MNATIDVVCYKWKKLKNNELPLILRVTKNRKKRHLNLGVSLKPEYWDFENKRPKRNCPNKEFIEQLIVEKIRSYKEQILEYKIEDKDFTAKSLIEKVSNPIKANPTFTPSVQNSRIVRTSAVNPEAAVTYKFSFF